MPAVGGVSLTDLSPVSHLLNAPTRRLTWLTILKASVAVAVAWQIASALPGDDSPVFAPIVALTTVQSSLYGTFAQGFQTAAGNIIGVALATGLVNVAGRTAVALFVATFVGLAVSKRLPIGSGARGQITFSMILVVALGPTSGYATARLLDCAIGGAVGIVVALLAPERPQIEPVRTAIGSWARGIRESLRDIAAALAVTNGRPVPSAEQHPFVDRMLGRLRAAEEALASSVTVAFESIQFNPRARRQKAKVQELADVLPWCRRMSLQVEALALGVDALYDRSSHQPRIDRLVLGELLLDAAALVPDHMTAPDPEAAAKLQATLEQTLRDATYRQASVAMVLDSVSLLGRLEHLVVELSEASTVPLALGGRARPAEGRRSSAE